MDSRIFVAAAVLAVAGQSHAQADSLSETDKAYLTQERRGATYELESANLAVSRAVREDVRNYARKLVNDHGNYNAALEKLGKEQGLTLPIEPDAADKAHMADLEKLNGTAFDALYVEEALRINAEDKASADKEKSETKSTAIKDFLAKFADMDAEHEKLAKELEKRNG